MSKRIPKPIIIIGHDTKLNGKISYEIDGNKVHKMSVVQFTELITELGKIRRKLVVLRDKNAIDNILTEYQYEEIENLIKDGGFLTAIKLYREYADVGLKDAKIFVENLKESIK